MIYYVPIAIEELIVRPYRLGLLSQITVMDENVGSTPAGRSAVLVHRLVHQGQVRWFPVLPLEKNGMHRGVAQMEERCVWDAEAKGSSPFSPT